MRLFDAAGYGLSLGVLGYEFPELDDVPYDSNWLLIQLDVRYPQIRWQGTDSCLLTWEARELADWLDEVRCYPLPGARIAFFEPLLGFNVSESRCLVIEFWHPEQGCDYEIELVIDELELAEVASSLRHALSRYPQRTSR